jgi:hypothetical protein
MLRWPPMPGVAPAATQRTTARGSWPQKLVWVIWLAAAVRGIWLLVRRRAND